MKDVDGSGADPVGPMPARVAVTLLPQDRDDRVTEMSAMARISRRELLQTAALLALGTTGCASFTNNVRMAFVAAGGLSSREFSVLLGALLRAVLAYDHPEFAAGTQAAVAERLLSYFPLDRDPQLAPLRTALALFEHIDLLATVPPPMRQAERSLLAAEGVAGDAADVAMAKREAEDLRSYQLFRQTSPAVRFSQAELQDARVYLRLWGRSALLMRRRIYSAVRGMILVSAYSLPAHWEAIGYAGPLLPQPESRRL